MRKKLYIRILAAFMAAAMVSSSDVSVAYASALDTYPDGQPVLSSEDTDILTEDTLITDDPQPLKEAENITSVNPQDEDAASPDAEEENTPSPDTDEENAEPGNVSTSVVFNGMPEGLSLSDKQLKEKAGLRSHKIPDTLRQLEAGYDYVADEFVYLTDTEEEAALIAAAYNSVLSDYSYGVAVAKLPDGISVTDVIDSAAYDGLMPPVYPNYIGRLEEPVEDESEYPEITAEGFTMPQAGDYVTWVHGENGLKPLLANPDIYLRNPSNPAESYQWHHEMVDTYGAWSSTMGSRNIKVAVIDSGVSKDHEELKGRVTQRPVGTIPAAPASGRNHGTHCAGIIAASAGNGKGGAGIAPGVSIYSYNVFGDSDSYIYADLVQGINLAVSDKVNIISMSLGGYDYYYPIQEAINKAYASNITVVVSMGNSGTNVKTFPAGLDHVIAVTSVDRNGTLSEFSNYGNWADIAAPGSHIVSSVISGYDTYSGTSMAAPVVSGVAALYMSRFGNPGPDKMEKLLKSNTTKVNSNNAGVGIVNACNMFTSDDLAPVITVTDKSGKQITNFNTPLPAGAKISINPRQGAGTNDLIIYTTDGSKPSVKDGELVNGIEYTGPVTIDDKASSSSVTINAFVISGTGLIGKPASLKVKAPDKSKAADLKIKSVSLDKKSVDLKYRTGASSSDVIRIASLKNTNNEDVNIRNYKYEWVSSNPSVAAVISQADGSAKVTAAGGGSAKITLNILDGSKKSASFTVKVSRLPDEITVNGQTAIEAGASATYKASLTPAKVNSKTVTWSITPETDGVNINIKNGKVTVGKDVKNGTSFTVTATSADDGAVRGNLKVTVRNKMKNLTISAGTDKRASKNSKGQLTSVTLFSHDITSSSIKENTITLTAVSDSGNTQDVIWSLDRSSSAEITGSDRGNKVTITGLAPGTVKLACTAADGSGKKANINIVVINPASGITITPNDDSYHNICIGKSAKATAVLGTAYGKPTVTAVDWKFKVTKCELELEQDTRSGYEYMKYVRGYNNLGTDLTDKFKNAVKINKTGTVSIDKKKWEAAIKNGNYYDEYRLPLTMHLEVTASTTDGTNLKATSDYYVNAQPIVLNAKYNDHDNFFISGLNYFGPLKTSTSAPDIASCEYDCCFYDSYNKVFVYQISLHPTYKGLKKKTAVTFKSTTTDGSNKTIPLKLMFLP